MKPESLEWSFTFTDGQSLRFWGVSHSQRFEGQWACALKDLFRNGSDEREYAKFRRGEAVNHAKRIISCYEFDGDPVV